jgi:hypothetical protein
MLPVRWYKMAVDVENTIERLPSILSAEESLALFDGEARRITGMSGPEFLAKWDAGAYADINLDETREGRDMMYLASLIPFGRRVS